MVQRYGHLRGSLSSPLRNRCRKASAIGERGRTSLQEPWTGLSASWSSRGVHKRPGTIRAIRAGTNGRFRKDVLRYCVSELSTLNLAQRVALRLRGSAWSA